MLYCYMDIKYAILLCGYQVCYIAMWISSVLYCYADIKHTFPCYVDITVDIHITGDINIPMSDPGLLLLIAQMEMNNCNVFRR